MIHANDIPPNSNESEDHADDKRKLTTNRVNRQDTVPRENHAKARRSRIWSASDRMLKLLEQRAHSEKELREKLGRKHTPEEVDMALELAHRHRLIEPENELAARLVQQLHERGKGMRYILNQLARRGLPPITTDPTQEVEKARRLVQKKFPEGPVEDIKLKTKLRIKIQRFLAGRGFERDIVEEVVNEFVGEFNDEIDDEFDDEFDDEIDGETID
jgi:SOS response regulatory protein OraA/RecX